MKSFSILVLVLCASTLSAQTVFWTEDFGSGCNTALLATNYPSPNGAWTVTNTGTNAASANVWYVSAEENGNAVGQCGSACGSNRTLHLGNVAVSFVPADIGAAYYEGLTGLCGFIPCAATSKRVESPVINCSAHSNITLAFKYIEGGNVIDNATLWYYNGSAWSQIADPPKTSVCGNGQGIWTAYSISLPASANNNPNVRIGFQWINNDDGDATDPSFAVDDITLSAPSTGPDTVPPVVTCPGVQTAPLGANCSVALPNLVPLTTATDNVTPNPTITQSPAAGTIITSNTVVTMTATDAAGNSSTCTVQVNVADQTPPVVTCTNPNVNVPLGANCTATVPAYNANVNITDNCTPFGSLTITQSPAAGATISTTTAVTVTATDQAGNSASCTFNAVPNDQVPFSLVCPNNIIVNLPLGETSAQVVVPNPTFTDNCATSATYVNNFNQTNNASGTYNVGSTTVVFTGTSNLGETATCSMQVILNGGDCCPADLNCDGFIGVADLLIFNANFGCTNGCLGDLNGDNLVTVADLLIFTPQFGIYCP